MPLVSFIKMLFGALLLPPTNVLLLFGLAAVFRRRRWSLGLTVFAGFLLLAQCLPPIAGALIATLEDRAGNVLTDPAGAQAIVILGSGIALDAREYGGDTANERSLVRLRYGATAARRFNLPVLVTGGTPLTATRSEADVISDILEQEFLVPVRWRETQSLDTADNAQMSAELLRPAGIRRVILVTQAFHMPRAQRLFEDAGLEVVPAPTDFKKGSEKALTLTDWLPSARALYTTYYALHEWMGLAWFEMTRGLRPRA